MAYRDLVDERIERYDAADEVAPLFAPRAAVALAGFTPLEDKVMHLAREDGLGSIEGPGRIERLVGWLFGLHASGRALADPRLEALRKAVIVAYHRHHLPDAQVAQLRERGFTPAQVRAIEACAIAV